MRAQDYPLEKVEILLVGSPAQAKEWEPLALTPSPFAAINAIAAPGQSYYMLKNRGAACAAGEILAFLDSDVCPGPGWLRVLTDDIRKGADATCGPSMFQSSDPASASRLSHLIAAAISWGFIIGSRGTARGFLSHNLGFRKAVFDQLRYRTEFGRTCAGSFLMEDMRRSGVCPVFQSKQRVLHRFAWKWWIAKLHVRFGHEVYLLHRLDSKMVSSAASRLGPRRKA